MQRFALLACAALAACPAFAARASTEPNERALHFRFRLDNDYSTSAGAFDASGTLVRTLWSNRRYTAGLHDATWDGLDDDGRAVRGDSEYEIRVLTHNVIYTWDGVIGNSSPEATSPLAHNSQHPIEGFAVSGDRAFFTTRDEGRVPTMRYFRLDDPQSWHERPALPLAYDATMGLVTADGERVYWAHDSSSWDNTWGNGGDQAFIMATDRDLSREIEFSAGIPTCVLRRGTACYRDAEMDANIRSAIDVVTEFREDPATRELEGARNDVTGLAVQVDGPLLFAAHGSLSPARIHVLDKRSGRVLARLPLPGVGQLVAVPGRDELWAIHDSAAGRVVSHLEIGPAPDYTLKLVRTLAGVESPLALSLTPDGQQVVVVEGGASQQVRAFDADTGEPVWQLGQKGGYAVNGPRVSTDKFSFHLGLIDEKTSQRMEHALLGFAPDGSFWLGDTALNRLLEFDSGHRAVDEIAFMPTFYTLVADRNDASRLFAEYAEYSVDYTKPLGRSWQLLRFFGDSPQLTVDHRGFGTGFIDVATFRNGSTYGLARMANGRVEVMRIPADGDLQRFPLRLQQPIFLNGNGDLYGYRTNNGGRTEIWQRPLIDFDEDGAPSWGREETRVRWMRGTREPRANNGNSYERGVAPLDPGLHVVFDAGNSEAGRFHLGAIREGDGRWLWQASPATGEFDLAQPDGVFDTSQPWYAGMQVSTLGDQIVYNFHGEGWHNDGQANQFLHWYRDGLFVGQFGTPRVREMPPGAPGMAGNSFSIQLVAANGQTYLWHNDENAHSGIHRWHLDGTEWMRELKGRGYVGEDIELGGGAGGAVPSDASVPLRPAPSRLVATADRSGVHLTWRAPAGGADAIEVQRLQPTYVGQRFERVALLPGNATSLVDDQPLYGEPTVYRARAFVDGHASDYSNHVHLTTPAKNVVLESQSFEKPPGDLRDEYRPAPTDDVSVSVISDPASSSNRVMRVLARRPAGSQQFWVRPRWTASPQLFEALNNSMGRATGSRPDIYRVQFDVRFLQSRVSPGSTVSVQVDPWYDLFSTPGRRADLIALADAKADQPQDSSRTVSFDFAALPDGGGSHGLQQYRATAPVSVAVRFPIDLRGDGDVVEFLIDNVTVSRLDAP